MERKQNPLRSNLIAELPSEVAEIHRMLDQSFPQTEDFRRIQTLRKMVAETPTDHDRIFLQTAFVLHYLNYGGATQHEVKTALLEIIKNLTSHASLMNLINEFTVCLSNQFNENLLPLLPSAFCRYPEIQLFPQEPTSKRQFYASINAALYQLADCKNLEAVKSIIAKTLQTIGFCSAVIYTKNPESITVSWCRAPKNARSESIFPKIISILATEKPICAMNYTELLEADVTVVPGLEIFSNHWQFDKSGPLYVFFGLAGQGVLSGVKLDVPVNIGYLVRNIQRHLKLS